jgi:hypothetical protein
VVAAKSAYRRRLPIKQYLKAAHIRVNVTAGSSDNSSSRWRNPLRFFDGRPQGGRVVIEKVLPFSHYLRLPLLSPR